MKISRNTKFKISPHLISCGYSVLKEAIKQLKQDDTPEAVCFNCGAVFFQLIKSDSTNIKILKDCSMCHEYETMAEVNTK